MQQHSVLSDKHQGYTDHALSIFSFFPSKQCCILSHAGFGEDFHYCDPKTESLAIEDGPVVISRAILYSMEVTRTRRITTLNIHPTPIPQNYTNQLPASPVDSSPATVAFKQWLLASNFFQGCLQAACGMHMLTWLLRGLDVPMLGQDSE